MKLILLDDEGSEIETITITKEDLRKDEAISWLEGAIEVHEENINASPIKRHDKNCQCDPCLLRFIGIQRRAIRR